MCHITFIGWSQWSNIKRGKRLTVAESFIWRKWLPLLQQCPPCNLRQEFDGHILPDCWLGSFLAISFQISIIDETVGCNNDFVTNLATRQHSRAKSLALRVVHRAEDAQNTVRKSTKRQPMPAMPVANMWQHVTHLSLKQTLRFHSGRPVSQCYGTHECFVFRLSGGLGNEK